jgi:serine/threonine protein kinase
MLYEMLTGKAPYSGANPFVTMNDKLLNNPVPPREVDATVTPQLQEIIYRALERDPKNRYATAKEFMWDLEHQDQVGVADRPELRNWTRRRTPWPRRIAFYVILALIPVAIFALMYWVAQHAK